MKDWSDYQKRTYNIEPSKLLKYFIDNYEIKTATDLGCGSGNETVYMIKKGIKVTAVDIQLNEDYILSRLDDDEKQNVAFKKQDFESIELEKTDAVVALFSIPFCKPEKFNDLWSKIYDSINDNGYFVGQLAGDRDDWRNNSNMNTFTIEEAKNLLSKYNVLRLDEREFVRETDNKKWHFYNIIARKENM